MITIHFTQCCPYFKQDSFSQEMTLAPMRPRVYQYKAILHEAAALGKDTEFWTLDENFLLVAQCLRRKGTIKELTFVSHCDCRTEGKEEALSIPIDSDGDFTEDPHHGFFDQRLRYLR